MHRPLQRRLMHPACALVALSFVLGCASDASPPPGAPQSPAPAEPSGFFELFEARGLTGSTYYVSGSGSDANDGLSQERPLRTLQAAHDRTEPGDQVLVMNGTYENTTDDWRPVLLVHRSGTAKNWIRYAALPGHTPHIKFHASGGIRIRDAAYIVVSGLTIEGNRVSSGLTASEVESWSKNQDFTWDKRINGSGITVQWDWDDATRQRTDGFSHHVIIENNVVFDCPGGGISTNTADYIIIRGNTVHHNAYFSPWQTSGISLYQQWNSDSSTGYKNFVLDNVTYANANYVRYPGKDKVTDGNGIIIDDFRNIQTEADAIKQYRDPYVGRTLVGNNLSYENGACCIQLYLTDHVDVVNNTCFENGRVEDTRCELSAADVRDVRLSNTIVQPLQGQPAVRVVAWFESKYGPIENVYLDGALVPDLATSGIPSDLGATNVIAGDPAFVDPARGNFRLSPQSAAVNGGSGALFMPKDLEGTARPQGAGVDLGAYELRQ
jgi:parallel beta-helix repeat protein